MVKWCATAQKQLPTCLPPLGSSAAPAPPRPLCFIAHAPATSQIAIAPPNHGLQTTAHPTYLLPHPALSFQEFDYEAPVKLLDRMLHAQAENSSQQVHARDGSGARRRGEIKLCELIRSLQLCWLAGCRDS